MHVSLAVPDLRRNVAVGGVMSAEVQFAVWRRWHGSRGWQHGSGGQVAWWVRVVWSVRGSHGWIVAQRCRRASHCRERESQ